MNQDMQFDKKVVFDLAYRLKLAVGLGEYGRIEIVVHDGEIKRVNPTIYIQGEERGQ